MIIKMPEPAHRSQMAAIWSKAFGDPDECIDAFFATGFCAERCCIAFDGRVLAAAYWFDLTWQGRRYALLYAVAVDPARQGRGIGSRLINGVCQALQEQGYAGAVLIPGSESLYGYYEKLGFRAFGGAAVFRAVAAGESIALREVNSQEYLQDRPGFAWDGTYGAYLQSQCRLYRGQDIWLMCYRQGADIQEYIGPAEKLPGALCALGLAEARVRMPGKDGPAGMCRTFGSCGLPGYLGPMLD